ncbi:hypothetical protein D3C81_1217740 [compost metagenome]
MLGLRAYRHIGHTAGAGQVARGSGGGQPGFGGGHVGAALQDIGVHWRHRGVQRGPVRHQAIVDQRARHADRRGQSRLVAGVVGLGVAQVALGAQRFQLELGDVGAGDVAGLQPGLIGLLGAGIQADGLGQHLEPGLADHGLVPGLVHRAKLLRHDGLGGLAGGGAGLAGRIHAQVALVGRFDDLIDAQRGIHRLAAQAARSHPRVRIDISDPEAQDRIRPLRGDLDIGLARFLAAPGGNDVAIAALGVEPRLGERQRGLGRWRHTGAVRGHRLAGGVASNGCHSQQHGHGGAGN